MRKLKNALVAGAAVLGLAGAAAAADRHVISVDLPSRTVAHMTYKDEVSPSVKVVPVGELGLLPMSRFEWTSPFDGFDQLIAEMRAQHIAMMRQAAAIAAQAGAGDSAGAPRFAAEGGFPAGSYRYTFISTSTGDGACGRVVEVTSRPNAAPQRVSRSFGNCAGETAPPLRPAMPAREMSRPALPTA